VFASSYFMFDSKTDWATTLLGDFSQSHLVALAANMAEKLRSDVS
jgi:hypothetical protein